MEEENQEGRVREEDREMDREEGKGEGEEERRRERRKWRKGIGERGKRGHREKESYIKQLFIRQCINYIAVEIRLNMASE